MLNPQARPFEYGYGRRCWIQAPAPKPDFLPHHTAPYFPYYSCQLPQVHHHWRATCFNPCYCLPPPPPPAVVSFAPIPSTHPRMLKLEEVEQDEALGFVKTDQGPEKMLDFKGRVRRFPRNRERKRAANWVPKGQAGHLSAGGHVAYPVSEVSNANRRGGRRNVGSVRAPRDGSQHHSSQFEFKEPGHENEGRTTLMVKNIPNKISRGMFIKMLDDFCIGKNQKVEASLESDYSAYDFLYLPFDFRNRCNLGYAFVNFTTTGAAFRLYKSFHNFKWTSFASHKVCQVTYARIQGKTKLLNHFQKSYFCCDSDDYLPVLFTPARDGYTSRPEPQLICSRIY